MINEEDHLRIQVLRPGLDFGSVWKVADALDTGIESAISYAYDGELGFSACPTNLGTGMRASAMMHLPGLVMSKNMDKVINAVNQLGIAVRGLFGEGRMQTEVSFKFRINRLWANPKPPSLIVSTTPSTISFARKTSRREATSGRWGRLTDKMSRAIGILKSCYLIQSSEAMDCLSLIRLASDFGMLPEKYRNLADRMFIEVQPGHVQLSAGKPVEAAYRDSLQAELLRKEFLELRRSIRRLRQVDFSRFAIYKTVMSEPMSNFTPRAQQVLALARKEADRFHHNYVGTEHLLLGLINLGQGVAVNVLQKMGLDLDTVRQAVDEQVGLGPEAKPSGNVPYTPRVKKVLALAGKEAKGLNHSYVGTEHILLGLLREGEGVAARGLKSLDVDVDRCRNEILSELDPNFSSSEETEASVAGNLGTEEKGKDMKPLP